MPILIKTTMVHFAHFLHKRSSRGSGAHSIGVATIAIASLRRIVIKTRYPDWTRLEENGADVTIIIIGRVGDDGFGSAKGRFDLT